MKIYIYKKINAIEHGWFADGSFSLFFLFFLANYTLNILTVYSIQIQMPYVVQVTIETL